MKYDVVAIAWKDITSATDSSKDSDIDTALLPFANFGVVLGEHVDSEGMRFVRICSKLSLSEHYDRNDYIDVPLGVITKTVKIGEWDDAK